MAQTTFSGPLLSGDRPAGITGGSNIGRVVLSQTVLIGFDATLVQSATVNLPRNSQIVNIIPDVLTVFDSATSATLSVGTAAAGTQYASGVNVKAATGRVLPTLTAAQLTAAASTGTTDTVVATVTSVGQPTVGSVRVTYLYVQTQSSTD